MLPYAYDEDTLAWILSSDWNFLKEDTAERERPNRIHLCLAQLKSWP